MPQERQYSDLDIIEMLQECKDKHGKVTPKVFNGNVDFCSASLAMRRFGSWGEAKKAAGIDEDLSGETGRNQKYTDEQLLSHLRKVDRKYGKCTTELLLKEDGLCAPSVVVDRFGSWTEGKKKAGLKPDERTNNERPKQYSDEEYLQLLRDCHEKHGEITQQLFTDDDDYPSEGAIRKRFGSWVDAIDEAGLPRNAGGGTNKYSDEDLIEQMRQCYEKHGKCTVRKFKSDEEFASPETVQRRFGSWSEAKEQSRVISASTSTDPSEQSQEQTGEVTENQSASSSDESLRDLRKQAEEDAEENVTTTNQSTPTEEYSRSAKVKKYVKARAEGTCEGCGEPAPFTSSSGGPYLHAHHVHELSDGGPDTPDTVIALCPNCHYRVHHGEDGPEYNNELIAKLEDIEG